MSAPAGKRDRKREAEIKHLFADSFCFGKKDCVLLWDSNWPMTGPPGNPEATPECSAEWRGVEMYGHNANDDTPFSEFP